MQDWPQKWLVVVLSLSLTFINTSYLVNIFYLYRLAFCAVLSWSLRYYFNVNSLPGHCFFCILFWHAKFTSRCWQEQENQTIILDQYISQVMWLAAHGAFLCCMQNNNNNANWEWECVTIYPNNKKVYIFVCSDSKHYINLGYFSLLHYLIVFFL